MKGVQVSALGGPEQAVYKEDLEKPTAGPGQVLVQVAYASMNPLDTHARTGRIDWMAPTLPFVVGYEYSGRVVEVGEGVDESLKGKLVISFGNWGGCGEFAVAPADRIMEMPSQFHSNLPLGTTYHSPCLSAWHLVHSAGQLQSGQSLYLTSAAGPVGLMASQFAKLAGVRVFGSTSTSEKVEFAMKHGGFEQVFNYKEQDVAAEVKKATEGMGVNCIIDGVCAEGCIASNLEMCAIGAQVIFIGAMGGFPPTVQSFELFGKSVAIRGFVVYHYLAGGKGYAEVHEALSNNKANLPITKQVPLKDVRQLHEDFEAGKILGKAIVVVGGDEV